MDNASVYGTEDCRFDSCRGRNIFTYAMTRQVLLWLRVLFKFELVRLLPLVESVLRDEQANGVQAAANRTAVGFV